MVFDTLLLYNESFKLYDKLIIRLFISLIYFLKYYYLYDYIIIYLKNFILISIVCLIYRFISNRLYIKGEKATLWGVNGLIIIVINRL